MPRPGKLFLPLDVDFFDSEMFEQVGEAAAVLYLAMSCKSKSKMSDGVLTEGMIARIGLARWPARLATLIEHGRVVRLDDGRYWIVAFTVHNATAADIAMQRKKDRERKGSGRNPSGTRPDSALREKLETERREVTVPHGPCPGCSEPDCPSPALRVVGRP